MVSEKVNTCLLTIEVLVELAEEGVILNYPLMFKHIKDLTKQIKKELS
ncbi:unnamed protein product [marine sediment metagenome]|uniref:Uncharacterized protein n=1 Tax=marine sediment metagenome TaxID=412755 RepID=X1REP5_9ZZZZ